MRKHLRNTLIAALAGVSWELAPLWCLPVMLSNAEDAEIVKLMQHRGCLLLFKVEFCLLTVC